MFNAKVYTVSIPSSGVALEEEYMAREVIARWNMEEGEKHGVVFLTIPRNYGGITLDIYIFAIDNYVDVKKVETAIQTDAKVKLFFCSHQDEENTIPAELKEVEALKNNKVPNCVKVSYNGCYDFQ